MCTSFPLWYVSSGMVGIKSSTILKSIISWGQDTCTNVNHFDFVRKNIIKNGLEKAEFIKDLCTDVIGGIILELTFCWAVSFFNKNFANLSLFSGITRPEQELLTKYLLQKLLGKNVPYTEPVFVNVYRAQESISPAYVASWRASTTNRIAVTAWESISPGWESIPGLLKEVYKYGLSPFRPQRRGLE